MSVQELAASVVSLSKFGPQGVRGYGSPFTHHAFGVDAREYELTCNEHLLTILQIESQQGLDNIEAIAAVPGVGEFRFNALGLARSVALRRLPRPLTLGSLQM